MIEIKIGIDIENKRITNLFIPDGIDSKEACIILNGASNILLTSPDKTEKKILTPEKKIILGSNIGKNKR